MIKASSLPQHWIPLVFGLVLCILSIVFQGAFMSSILQVRRWHLQDTSQLEDTVQKLQAENLSLQFIQEQNMILKDTLGVVENNPEYRPILGDVFYDNPLFVRNTLNINIGSDQGVILDAPVIVRGYLVGKITNVRPQTSEVSLITDVRTSIPISIQRTDATSVGGIMKGRYGTSIFIDLVPKLESIQVTDRVYTAETNTIPAGIPIGTIKNIDEGSLFYDILVEHPIRFDIIQSVIVIVKKSE